MSENLRPDESCHGAFCVELVEGIEVMRGGLVTDGARVSGVMGSLSASSALYGVGNHLDEYLEGLFSKPVELSTDDEY